MLVVPIQGSGLKMVLAGDGGDGPGRSVHVKLAVLWLSASLCCDPLRRHLVNSILKNLFSQLACFANSGFWPKNGICR